MKILEMYKNGEIEKINPIKRNDFVIEEVKKNLPELKTIYFNLENGNPLNRNLNEDIKKLKLTQEILNIKGMANTYSKIYKDKNKKIIDYFEKQNKSVIDLHPNLYLEEHVLDSGNFLFLKIGEIKICDFKSISLHEVFKRILEEDNKLDDDLFMLFLPYFKSPIVNRIKMFYLLKTFLKYENLEKIKKLKKETSFIDENETKDLFLDMLAKHSKK